MDDPSKILGLEPGADSEQIGRAYRTLARRYPPELNPDRFARIHRAYEQLRSFERAMEEARKAPEAALESLFPAPRVTVKPGEPDPEPLEPQELEPLLRPLRRTLLARLLRDALTG